MDISLVLRIVSMRFKKNKHYKAGEACFVAAHSIDALGKPVLGSWHKEKAKENDRCDWIDLGQC